MELIKYRQVSRHDFVSRAGRYAELDDKQKEALEEYLDGHGLGIVEYKINKPSGNLLLRITVIFYFLFIILLVIAGCIKWLFIGVHYYKHNGKLMRFREDWHDAIFDTTIK